MKLWVIIPQFSPFSKFVCLFIFRLIPPSTYSSCLPILAHDYLSSSLFHNNVGQFANMHVTVNVCNW